MASGRKTPTKLSIGGESDKLDDFSAMGGLGAIQEISGELVSPTNSALNSALVSPALASKTLQHSGALFSYKHSYLLNPTDLGKKEDDTVADEKEGDITTHLHLEIALAEAGVVFPPLELEASLPEHIRQSAAFDILSKNKVHLLEMVKNCLDDSRSDVKPSIQLSIEESAEGTVRISFEDNGKGFNDRYIKSDELGAEISFRRCLLDRTVSGSGHSVMSDKVNKADKFGMAGQGMADLYHAIRGKEGDLFISNRPDPKNPGKCLGATITLVSSIGPRLTKALDSATSDRYDLLPGLSLLNSPAPSPLPSPAPSPARKVEVKSDSGLGLASYQKK